MPLALITGASMGLGEEFARQIAARGLDVALSARGADALERLAAELRERHGVRAWALPCDLSEPGAAARLAARLDELGLAPDWLVNNAGLGDAGRFETLDPARLSASLMVNVVALTELTRLLLPGMLGRPDARIINVASTAAFQPVPWFTTYAAAKAYVLSFSEGLHEELRARRGVTRRVGEGSPDESSPRAAGVRVTCVCPGPTATGFNANNAIEVREREGGRAGMPRKPQSAAEVARLALQASDRGRAVIVTQGRAELLLERLLPRAWVRRIAGRITRMGKKVE